jgi:flagellar biosynthesis protein FliR
MPADIGLLFSFLSVLARVSGALVFLPIPGIRSGPDAAKIVVSLALTVALYPVWPAIPDGPKTVGWCAALLMSEGAFGVAAGLCVSFLIDGFILAAQVLGLQAGFSYSSTIDPSSQADSTVLQVFIQLIAGLLFFATGIHFHVIRAFSASLESVPPGSFTLSPALVPAIARLGAGMLSLGVRLALPVVALLLLVDLSLALMGRINAQLQLLSLAFPAKMLAALLLLAASAPLFPILFEHSGMRTVEALYRLGAKR